MTLYILDTDHITFHQRGHPLASRRAAQFGPDGLAVTIISAEEQLRGWLDAVRRATTASKLALAYTSLQDTLGYFCTIPILDFGAEAYAQYAVLRDQKIRVGTQDLRIAATVLSLKGILVTRNLRDFRQVPGLLIEDWTTS